MSTNKSLTKKQEQLLAMIEQGWIPLQVTAYNGIYFVNSANNIGYQYKVEPCDILGLTCTHEYGEYNEHHPCNHIRAVQEYQHSNLACQTFDQQVHLMCRQNQLQATKGRSRWEWLISDSRGMSIGCMGVTVADSKAQWWATYEGNHQATWDTCQEALDYLIAAVSF